jgi:hypothetical protein
MFKLSLSLSLEECGRGASSSAARAGFKAPCSGRILKTLNNTRKEEGREGFFRSGLGVGVGNDHSSAGHAEHSDPSEHAQHPLAPGTQSTAIRAGSRNTQPAANMRFARSALAAAAAAALAAAASAATTAAAAAPITIDGAAAAHTFTGHGGLSAGASSRLLWDYAPAQRADILDMLFKPQHGMGLHILKGESDKLKLGTYSDLRTL